jgi:hypothetical protein
MHSWTHEARDQLSKNDMCRRYASCMQDTTVVFLYSALHLLRRSHGGQLKIETVISPMLITQGTADSTLYFRADSACL